MKAKFEELDSKTRQYMKEEFEKEQKSNNPYISPRLSTEGQRVFSSLMIVAISSGDEETLKNELCKKQYFNDTEQYERNGERKERIINYEQASEQLAFSEFNTWYVRGLTKKLIDEGIEKCQIYRVKQPKWEPAECSIHEGQIVDVEIIYNGHRSKYWPKKNGSAFSIPAQPGCHHSIRRVKV